MFLSKMGAARFVAGERVDAHQLGELEEIGDSAGALERLIERFAFAEDSHVPPEFFAQLRDACERFAQPGFVPRHSAFVPKHQDRKSTRLNSSHVSESR